MSFWSWIGLADKREISALQSEISSLRAENKDFQEQNRKLLEEIKEANNKNLDITISEISNIREKIEVIRKNVLERLQANSELSTSEKDEVINEITKCTEGIEGVLFKFREQMDESYQYILSNNQLINESGKQIDEIVTVSKLLEQKTNNMDGFQESLSSLAESVKYLWTIMKAIWVDSVLSDIDSLK